MRQLSLPALATLAILTSGMSAATTAEAQTIRGIGRRAARAVQREVNRSDYYAPQTWQQMSPWIEQNRVAPLARAANAVRETVDAATTVGDGQFGYRDSDPANEWFYDYYTYTPTYYQYDSGDRYTNAVRYFDTDNDGVYDSRASYRDSDDDGQYDEYERYDFSSPVAAAKDSRQVVASDSYNGPEDARRYTVEGEIVSTKKARVNGSENLIVGVKRDQGDQIAIDAGPFDELRGSEISVGTSVAATGPVERIGEKQVLIADSLRVQGSQPITIRRSIGIPLSGQIVDVKTTRVDNSDHYFAVVESESGRHLVDFGPTSSYKMDITPSSAVSIRGIPVQVQQNQVMMATQVELGGQTISINPNPSIR